MCAFSMRVLWLLIVGNVTESRGQGRACYGPKMGYSAVAVLLMPASVVSLRAGLHLETHFSSSPSHKKYINLPPYVRGRPCLLTYPFACSLPTYLITTCPCPAPPNPLLLPLACNPPAGTRPPPHARPSQCLFRWGITSCGHGRSPTRTGRRRCW